MEAYGSLLCPNTEWKDWCDQSGLTKGICPDSVQDDLEAYVELYTRTHEFKYELMGDLFALFVLDRDNIDEFENKYEAIFSILTWKEIASDHPGMWVKYNELSDQKISRYHWVTTFSVETVVIWDPTGFSINLCF